MGRQDSAYPRLGVRHAVALAVLAEAPESGQTPDELVARIGLDRRSMIVTLGALLTSRLVETAGRRYVLTDAGRALLAPAERPAA